MYICITLQGMTVVAISTTVAEILFWVDTSKTINLAFPAPHLQHAAPAPTLQHPQLQHPQWQKPIPTIPPDKSGSSI